MLDNVKCWTYVGPGKEEFFNDYSKLTSQDALKAAASSQKYMVELMQYTKELPTITYENKQLKFSSKRYPGGLFVRISLKK